MFSLDQLRTIEIKQGDQWVEARFDQLETGDIYRMREPGSKDLVVDEFGTVEWLVKSQPAVDADPVGRTLPPSHKDAYRTANKMMAEAAANPAASNIDIREKLIKAMNDWGDIYGKGWKAAHNLQGHYCVEVQPAVNGPKVSITLSDYGYSVTVHEHCFETEEL